MTMRLFAKTRDRRTIVTLPPTARANVAWLPRLGDIFPDFEGRTTKGTIEFHDWAEGQWSVLVSLPGCYSPVCTTELASLSAAEDEFDDRGVQLLAITRDDVDSQIQWLNDIESLYGRKVDFPVVADPLGVLTDTFGMVHPAHATAYTVRRTFIIDPALKIRAIQDYPAGIGRGIDEVLRLIDALKVQDAHEVGTPADWMPGDPVVLPHSMGDAEASERYGTGWQKFCSYLRVIPQERL